MSARNTTTEIDNMLTGFEVQAAVDLVVAYIKRKQKFFNAEAAHGYWSGLSTDEKLSVLKKALEQK